MTSKGPPAYGLTDDAAIFSPADGRDLIFTKDALVADVHFLSADPADLIAQKAMRVNLSDLAAMGAEPVGYLLALALPRTMDDIDSWVQSFSEGLALDQKEFGWTLFGGDTVATSGPLTISLTAIGAVDKGRALRRNGAISGDDIYVSGTLGDSALGLKCLQGAIAPESKTLIDRYHLPRPRLDLGQRLTGIASSAMDISDGLAGDIRHICALSGLGADIKAELIPLSPSAGKVLERLPEYKNLLWSGGDDYELLFTASGHAASEIRQISHDLGLRLTRIGSMTQEQTIAIRDKSGVNLLQENQGFRHF